MNPKLWNVSLLVTAVLVAVVSAASVWLAWNSSTDFTQRLTVLAVAPILAAALASYSLRILRFHYFLKRSGVGITLRGTAAVQAIGFALSVTPGHVGEVFKLHLIRERAGAPLVRTAPLLLLDRVTEGGGFLLLALGSALALPALRDRVPSASPILLGLAALLAFAGLQYLLRRGSGPRAADLERLPVLSRVWPHLVNLWHGLQSSFTVPQILGGLAFSAVARFADGLVVLFAANLLGVQLPLSAAVLVLAVSGLAGGISLLPAGTGAVETTMAGLLVVLGAALPTAIAITLLARLSTLWLWVALGLALAFVIRLPSVRLALARENVEDLPPGSRRKVS